MAVIVLPNRAAGVRPPFSGVNGDSLQALNLVLWYPIHGQGVELPASVGGGSTALALQNANTYYQSDPRYRYSVRAVITDPLGRTSGPDNVAVSSEFSLSFWFKWDDVTVWCAAVSKAAALGTNSSAWDWGILFNSTNYYLIRNGANTAATDGTAMYQNGWHHWLAVMSPTSGRNTSALYIDGKLHASFAGINATTATNNTATRYVQTQYGTTSNLTDLRIYNRYLSAQEALALYDPATRWDLYWVPSRRVYINAGGAPPASTQGPRSYHYMTHVWSK